MRNTLKTTEMSEVFEAKIEEMMDGEYSVIRMSKAIEELDIVELDERLEELSIGDFLALSKKIEEQLEDHFNGEDIEMLLQHLNRKVKLEMSKLFFILHEKDMAYIIVEGYQDLHKAPFWFLTLSETMNIDFYLEEEDKFYNFITRDGKLFEAEEEIDEEDLCISGDGQVCCNCGECCEDEDEDDMFFEEGDIEFDEEGRGCVDCGLGCLGCCDEDEEFNEPSIEERAEAMAGIVHLLGEIFGHDLVGVCMEEIIEEKKEECSCGECSCKSDGGAVAPNKPFNTAPF